MKFSIVLAVSASFLAISPTHGAGSRSASGCTGPASSAAALASGPGACCSDDLALVSSPGGNAKFHRTTPVDAPAQDTAPEDESSDKAAGGTDVATDETNGGNGGAVGQSDGKGNKG